MFIEECGVILLHHVATDEGEKGFAHSAPLVGYLVLLQIIIYNLSLLFTHQTDHPLVTLRFSRRYQYSLFSTLSHINCKNNAKKVE